MDTVCRRENVDILICGFSFSKAITSHSCGVVLTYLHSGLSEVYTLCKFFSREHIRIVCLLKHLLELTQLVAGESGAIAPLFFAVLSFLCR